MHAYINAAQECDSQPHSFCFNASAGSGLQFIAELRSRIYGDICLVLQNTGLHHGASETDYDLS